MISDFGFLIRDWRSCGRRQGRNCHEWRPNRGPSALAGRSNAKPDLLIWLARLVRADLDRHLSVKLSQEFQKLVGREPAEMPVEQMRHLRLLDAQHPGNLALLELAGGENLTDMKPELRPREKLVAITQA
jgi:hypothetical protein